MPTSDVYGIDSFLYRAHDSAGHSNAVEVILNIRNVNDPPVATDYEYDFTVSELDDLGILEVDDAQGLLARAHDIDYDNLTAELVGAPAHGSVLVAPNGGFVYQAQSDRPVDDFFTYRVLDDKGGFSNTKTVTIRISSEVVSRKLFYNASAFDQGDPVASVDDDQAVAPDKMALLPGETASFANYSSYARNQWDPDGHQPAGRNS